MKKFEQISVNEVAKDIYIDAMKQYHEKSKHRFDRVDYCQAWVTQTDDYIYLMSYSTIVAVIEKSTGFLADVLRMVFGYTATSAKHIAKFRHMFPVVREYTYRNI